MSETIFLSTLPEEIVDGLRRPKVGRRLKWDLRFLEMAAMVASWSKDPSTKCGAVVVRPDLTIASVGFNGFPRGCLDDAEMYEQRDLKLDRVIHAEVNAILSAKEPLTGYTMFSNPPCVHCTTCIIQAGISRVVYYGVDDFANGRWTESIERGRDLFDEAMVDVTTIVRHGDEKAPF